MQLQHIPDTDLDVSTLCFGTGAFGTTLCGDAADRLIAAFLEAGGNFFDTAHCYAFWEPDGNGASERELGASLRRLCATDRAIVATKGGHPDGGEKYRRPDAYLAENVLISDIEESLERLGFDRIDLYYLHRDDPRVPVEEILGPLNREIERGRLRALGASNWSVERLAEANACAAKHGWRGFAASQIQGSLATPNWQVGPEPTMRYLAEQEIAWHTESGMPVVAYSATANGYFSGEGMGNGGFDNPENRARRQRAAAVAARIGCTPTQVALAWLQHQPFPVIPLFSTGSPAHLAEVLISGSIPLTSDEASWLRAGGDQICA